MSSRHLDYILQKILPEKSESIIIYTHGHIFSIFSIRYAIEFAWSCHFFPKEVLGPPTPGSSLDDISLVPSEIQTWPPGHLELLKMMYDDVWWCSIFRGFHIHCWNGDCFFFYHLLGEKWSKNWRKYDSLRSGLQMSQTWRLRKSWPLSECLQTWLRWGCFFHFFGGGNVVEHTATYQKRITKKTYIAITSILKRCDVLHFFDI